MHYKSPSETGGNNVGEAVKKFQNFFHLPETGEVDEETLNAMKKPRCEDTDVEEEASRFKRSHAVIPWLKTSFTYYVQYSGQDLSESHQQRVRSGKAPAMRFPSLEQLTLTTLTLRSGESKIFLFCFCFSFYKFCFVFVFVLFFCLFCFFVAKLTLLQKMFQTFELHSSL